MGLSPFVNNVVGHVPTIGCTCGWEGGVREGGGGGSAVEEPCGPRLARLV